MDRERVLESWKEIATYLHRNIRTCQVWEHELGLPVHRLNGSSKARVYAYRGELDHWLKEKLHDNGPSSDAAPGKRPSPGPARLPQWNIGLAAAMSVLTLAAVALSGRLLWRQSKIRWANDVALPEIERLLMTSETRRPFELAIQAEKYIANSPKLKRMWSLVAGTLTVETSPPGAKVYIQDYASQDSAWKLVGTTPLKSFRLHQGAEQWKAEKEGFEVSEGAVFIRAGFESSLNLTLDPAGSLPPGMIRVPGREHSVESYSLEAIPAVKLEDYLLDRHEVTNRQYREFIEAGGYRERRYWKNVFIKDGRPLPWEKAMPLFVDSTGRPGPSTWILGDYPQGAADQPVTGISWYEAAAYAEFAGKQLPSIFHWHHAAMSDSDSNFIILISDLNGRTLAPVGAFRGLGYFGAYDMAGNIKEWCWNESDGKRTILGGAWDDIQYWFVEYDGYPPLMREPNFGFRCMKLLPGTAPALEAFRPLRPIKAPDYDKMTACTDDVFKVFRSLYAYTKTGLNPRLESRADWSEDTIVEKVSFDDAFGEDRIIAYLFLPRKVSPPFQSVVYFPGSAAQRFDSICEYGSVKSREVELYTKSGRAFVFPVLSGTFERKIKGGASVSREYMRDVCIRLHRELARCLDYLETRPDFDMDKVAYEGLSWGAWSAPIHLALDKRFKAGVLLGGGLYYAIYLPVLCTPESDPINFAPRVTIPIIMQNGMYDMFFPLESSVRGLFRRLGTPEKDKHIVLYPAGHSIWLLNEYRKDTFDFLDKYLGPVQK